MTAVGDGFAVFVLGGVEGVEGRIGVNIFETRWRRVVGREMKMEGGNGNGEVARHIARSSAVDVVLRGERRGKCGVWGACGGRGNEACRYSGMGRMCLVGIRGGHDVYIKIIPRWSIWGARRGGAIDIDKWNSLSRYHTTSLATHCCQHFQ